MILHSVYHPPRVLEVVTAVSCEAWDEEYQVEGIRMRGPWGVSYPLALLATRGIIHSEGWTLSRKALAFRRAAERVASDKIMQFEPTAEVSHRWGELFGPEGKLHTIGRVEARHDIVREDGSPW